MPKSFRDRQEKRKGKKDLKRQQKDQEGRKDQKGRFPTIFKLDRLPKGMEVYKVRDGENYIDILPTFAGKYHPTADRGAESYVLEFYIHRNVGKNKEIIVCPYETFGRSCEICTFKKSQFFHKKIYSQLQPSRRNAYVVWDHKEREAEKKGPMVAEFAHKYMEKPLINAAKQPEGGGSVQFASIEEGKRIFFIKTGKGLDTEYDGHKLVARKKPIPAKIMDPLADFELDSVIDMKVSNKKIKKMFEPMISGLIKLNAKLEKQEKEMNSDSDAGSDSDTGRESEKDRKRRKKKEKARKEEKREKKEARKKKKKSYIKKYGEKKGLKKFEKKYGKKGKPMEDDVPF